MRVVAHGSPRVLEEDLLDRVFAAKAADPLASVLIVVPSRRLADHVARRLLARFGALVGVSVLQHQALAERILMETGVSVRHTLDEPLLATLFARILRDAPMGALRDFARTRPGAAVALRETVTDLREAGLDPDAVRDILPRSDGEVAALYARWSRALDALAAEGALDVAAMARAAAERAAGFGARFAAILHHGAYDLIGVHVDLLTALDRAREVSFLLPADPDDASGAFGVERARTIAGEAAPTKLATRAATPAVDFQTAQGARAELQAAVYGALAAVASGTPPDETAVIARSLAPYAAALHRLVDEGEPAWHTSFTRPLRRDPAVGASLRAIAAGGDRGARGFAAHADDFEARARTVTDGDALAPLLDAMRGVETVLHDGRSVAYTDALSWLEERVDASKVAPCGADGGGVRILDAMQARGLTFDHIGLAGMNSGLFPRIAREDPFLGDTSRRRLREATGRPLPIAAESGAEERLLLSMVLHQASKHLSVSWRRADETGRPLVPSLALRAIAADALQRARSLPAHPRSRFEAWAKAPGVLDPRDELALAGLASELGADAAPDAVASRRPDLVRGVAQVAETEAFSPTTGRYDGRIGVPFGRALMNATALERLGRCPLQFFFREVLRIVAPNVPPSPFTEDPRAVGERVHDALRRVYAHLMDERAFDDADPAARIARAPAILREAWAESLLTHPRRRTENLPALDAIEDAAWFRTLDAFLATDLRRLAAERAVPEAVERTVEGPIPGGPPGLVVGARLDRVVTGPAGPVVGDYKTGGHPADRVNVGAMVSGSELQVPVYALLAGARVDVLGVGPLHDGAFKRFDGFKTNALRNGVLETIRVLADLAGAGRYPIHPGDHCRSCDYVSACRSGHPPTEVREQAAPDARDARDCWDKSKEQPSLAAVRGAEHP